MSDEETFIDRMPVPGDPDYEAYTELVNRAHLYFSKIPDGAVYDVVFIDKFMENTK